MFPKHFLWGAATSSHQVEGNNKNNDWWQWEREGLTKELSATACRHYELYKVDFALAQQLHHNAYRLSLEWSRIEPREGHFAQAEIGHYHNLLRELQERNIKPVVTIHHFTNPTWFANKGGWLSKESPKLFLRYVKVVAENFAHDVNLWITINEPIVFAYHSYLKGIWPPGEKSFAKAWRVMQNMIMAHRLAYRAINAINQKENQKKPMVGIAKNLRPFKVCPRTNNPFVHLGVYLRHQLFNMLFLKKIKNTMDYIGVNYYEGEFDSNDWSLKLPLLGGNCTHVHGHIRHGNQLGWNFYPEGLLDVLIWCKKFNKPMLITENGTCEEDDSWRIKFIDEHLKEVEKALAAGCDVMGYLHWSLLDNFEWHHGFGPRFGLIEVDYKTFERRIKPSAEFLSRIIQKNRNAYAK